MTHNPPNLKLKNAEEIRIEVENALDWISCQFPGAVKFNYHNERTLNSIGLYLIIADEDKLTSMILQYGIMTALGFIEYFKQSENYEMCASLLRAINYCNRQYDAGLPDNMDSDKAAQYLKMTPSQIVNSINTKR